MVLLVSFSRSSNSSEYDLHSSSFVISNQVQFSISFCVGNRIGMYEMQLCNLRGMHSFSWPWWLWLLEHPSSVYVLGYRGKHCRFARCIQLLWPFPMQQVSALESSSALYSRVESSGWCWRFLVRDMFLNMLESHLLDEIMLILVRLLLSFHLLDIWSPASSLCAAAIFFFRIISVTFPAWKSIYDSSSSSCGS